MLGKTADEMHMLKESDSNAFEQVCKALLYQTMTFKAKAKSETYQDDQKVKVSTLSCSKVDWVQTGRDLVKMIDDFKSM